MIESIHLQNVKGHVDTTVKLGRITVLVGPNGSGKTSVLEAIEVIARLAESRTEQELVGERRLKPQHRQESNAPLVIQLAGEIANVPCWVELQSSIEEEDRIGEDGEEWSVMVEYPHLSSGVAGQSIDVFDSRRNADLTREERQIWQKWLHSLRSAELFRFEPRVIAAPASSTQQLPSVEFDGRNTAVTLKAIKLGYDDIWARIRDDMKKLVPNVENIGVEQIPFSRYEEQPSASDKTKPPVSGEWYRVFFDFRGAKHVPAFSASEGTLVSLALLTVLHGPNRPRVILLDDIEQTLHPTAQIEMVRQLKALLALPDMQDVQIVATTHSPYVLDALEYEDVRVFALDKEGAVAVKSLAEHPDAERLKGKLGAGELWTSDPEASWVVEKSA